MVNLQGPKAKILERFVQFVGSRMPLRKAIFATLGGEGLEAQIWQRHGVNPDNGWLIERNRSLRKRLISEHVAKGRYHFCNSLGQFPRAMRAIFGHEAKVDGFHLDFCGTVEPNISIVKRIMPLVLEGHGRCVAITVADQRRSIALEKHAQFKAKIATRLGKRETSRFLRELEAEQRALKHENTNVIKAAQREFGIFYTIAALLQKTQILPDAMERYIYRSDYGRGSFRMRNYLFHFGAAQAQNGLTADLKAMWTSSPLYVVDETGIKAMGITAIRRPRIIMNIEEKLRSQTSSLGALVATLKGAHQAEYEALIKVAVSAGSKSDETLLRGLFEQLRDRFDPTVNKAQIDSEEYLPIQDNKVKLVIDLMDAKLVSETAYSETVEKTVKTLGLQRKKNRFKIVGAMFARSQGSFRGSFVKRALNGLTEEQDIARVLDYLSRTYSALTDTSVTAATLKAEAKAFKGPRTKQS